MRHNALYQRAVSKVDAVENADRHGSQFVCAQSFFQKLSPFNYAHE
jgi:hypothetical protein